MPVSGSRLLFAGGGSQLAAPLVKRCLDAGMDVTIVSRSASSLLVQDGVEAMDWEGLRGRKQVFDSLVTAGPLPAMLPLLEASRIEINGRIVAFSSTSAETKASSTDAVERSYASSLLDAERRMLEWAKDRERLLIVRPSLVYGGHANDLVNRIARFLQHSRIFPLVGRGLGRRQPVHVDDLASACFAALDNTGASGFLTLAGREVLTFRSMIQRIADSMERNIRFLSLPTGVVRAGIRVARLLPSLDYLTPGMADRMNEDQVFDIQPACQVLDYAPRDFQPSVIGSSRAHRS